MMTSMLSIFGSIILFVFGLLIGSFLNATAGRWGTSRQNAKRSKCFQCGEKLTVVNLIPILSWLFQRGRCSSCFGSISARYPLIELMTAITFIGISVIAPSITWLVFYLVVASIMILISLIDFDQFIIPHELSVSLIVLAWAQLFISPTTLTSTQPTWWHFLAGPILATFFWGLWLITKGKGMGFADGTLALSIGWFLGLSMGITAVMSSFWIGTVISLLIITNAKLKNHSKTLSLKSAIPFGPYLVISFLLVLIFNLDLFSKFYVAI